MSKAKTIYRYSFVGEALKETLEELQHKHKLDDELIEELMTVFDQVSRLIEGQLQNYFEQCARRKVQYWLLNAADRGHRERVQVQSG